MLTSVIWREAADASNHDSYLNLADSQKFAKPQNKSPIQYGTLMGLVQHIAVMFSKLPRQNWLTKKVMAMKG